MDCLTHILPLLPPGPREYASAPLVRRTAGTRTAVRTGHWIRGRTSHGRLPHFRTILGAKAAPGGRHTWESRIHAGLAWRGVSARRHL
ncbi:hypothetical protein SHJG_7163 [Streptomyces hygroscopicus subsp. jinggangensis 5008]|nr:hypothetical protein SHJG_7163 [Streptomyces hygroscopicus subsp. jinggangensis 5008]AGF66584.1 hypothetical protein SHJGH_6922 [Streptomyces hygroscopicus subsp. jinggangensis TL01]